MTPEERRIHRDTYPRRCEARSRQTGEQCRRFKLVTHDKFCLKHAGRAFRKNSGLNRPDLKRELRKLTYTRYLGDRLATRVEQVAQASDFISLRDELNLCRVMVGDFLKLYNAVDEQIIRRAETDNPIAEETAATLRATCAAKVIDKLREVESIAKSAHAIEQSVSLDVKSLHSVVIQIARIVDGEFIKFAAEHDEVFEAEFIELSRKVVSKIQQNIHIPKKDSHATTNLLPGEIDATVVAMDKATGLQ